MSWLLLPRIRFALKYRSFRRIVRSPRDPRRIHVYHRGKEVTLPSRCPHQGASLESAYFSGDSLVCPWHGCRFKLN